MGDSTGETAPLKWVYFRPKSIDEGLGAGA
jgi:hypothetical protein